MKREFIRYMIVLLLCLLGIGGCSYSTYEPDLEGIQTKETPQNNNNAPNSDGDNFSTETKSESITENTVSAFSQKDGDSNGASEQSGAVSEPCYEMKLYTEAPNQDSSVKIQYPVFSGNKAEEINTLILTQVQDIARLDPSLFPENAKKTVDFQSAVTLQNSNIISIVFWGKIDINVSQFPTTNLYSLNIDLQSLKLITLTDLYTVNEEFEKTFFEKAFFPTDPITSYSAEEFPEMLKLQTPEYNTTRPFDIPQTVSCFLKPEGIVFSLFSVHASGSDHFEAELFYNDIQDYYLPEQSYWE